MSQLGAKKMRQIIIGQELAAKGDVQFIDPRIIRIPEDGHVYGRPYVANLVKGLKENLPAERQAEAIAEMDAVMGQRFHKSGASAGRLKRRLKRRLSALDARVAKETKNPMNSPNKAAKRQQRLKQRIIEMSFHLVSMLIRSTWRYRGRDWVPPAFEIPKAPVSKLDAYHERIQRVGTSIHPFESTTRLDAGQMAVVLSKIEEDRKAFKGALKEGRKLTIKNPESPTGDITQE